MSSRWLGIARRPCTSDRLGAPMSWRFAVGVSGCLFRGRPATPDMTTTRAPRRAPALRRAPAARARIVTSQGMLKLDPLRASIGDHLPPRDPAVRPSIATRLDNVAPVTATPDHDLRANAPLALLRDLPRDDDPHRSRRASDRQRRGPIVLRRTVAVEHAAEHMVTLEGKGARGNLEPASRVPVLVVERVDRQLGDLVLTHGARDRATVDAAEIRREPPWRCSQHKAARWRTRPRSRSSASATGSV